MFVESVTSPEAEWRAWSEKLRLYEDPPTALVASVAWRGEDGMVVQLNVWDTPSAVADNYMERVRPIVEIEGEPANKPERHGEPLAAYFRS